MIENSSIMNSIDDVYLVTTLDPIPLEAFTLQVEGAVESLSREILTIQTKGHKKAAKLLLQKHCTMTDPLKVALQRLEKVQVPVDIVPRFPVAENILIQNH